MLSVQTVATYHIKPANLFTLALPLPRKQNEGPSYFKKLSHYEYWLALKIYFSVGVQNFNDFKWPKYVVPQN